MNIPELLSSLKQRGITVEVDHGDLRVNAPIGLFSPDLQTVLQEKKAEIIGYLLGQQASVPTTFPIRRILRDRPIPASSFQRGLWSHYQLEGISSTYNVPLTYRLKGTLDIQALEKALQFLVTRHESLRMGFRAEQGQPYLLIRENVHCSLDIHLGNGETSEAELAQAATQPFSLEEPPLFRFHLWTDSAARHTLLLNFHHIILDGWSQGLLERDLSYAYDRIISGQEAALPALEFDYGDYAAWQQDWLKSQEFESGLAYWKTILQGAPDLLELPNDRPRPPMQTFKGSQCGLDLEQGLLASLQELARREHITLFMVIYAAYALLLSRYSRQEDIVIGVPMANRPRKDLEDILGFFVNTMPLRIDLSEDPTLPVLFARIRQMSLDAFSHQSIPFDKLAEANTSRRDPAYNPIFQVVLDFNNTTSQDLRFGDCEASHYYGNFSSAKFDLTFYMQKRDRQWHVDFQFNTALFELATMQRMLLHFQRILEWMATSPAGNISTLDLLTSSERQQLLVDWNTVTQYPRDKTIQEIFAEFAAATPDAPALLFAGQVLTYRQLNERANQLAHALRLLGVVPETRVAVFIERSIEMVVALLAILKAGGAYVPLDPAYSPEWRSFILEDTGSPILLTLRRHMPDLISFEGKLVCLDDAAVFAMQSLENPDVPLPAGNLAYIMYTSGSTGQPKGSCIPHRAVVRLVKDTDYADFGPEEAFLQFAPLAFDASTFEIWGSLLNGSKLIIFPAFLPRLDELAKFVKTNHVTTIWLTAGLFHQMMEWQPELVDDLHQLLSGGDVLSPRHVQIALQRNPRLRLINGYGPTENTTFTCCYTVPQTFDAVRSVPIGKPIANTTVYILDAHQNPLPIGIAGEIYTGGDGLSREYLNQPGLTSQKFIPDPFSSQPGMRLYRTGDFARWLPDGNIEFLGRMDDQVKLRGFRIDLGEIEHVLGKHEAVKDAIVLVRTDRPGDKQLVAYLILADGVTIAPAELREYLKSRLPTYMLPSAFVFLKAFPLTPNAKVDRKALPAPQPDESSSAEGYTAPFDALERQLVQVWEDLLNIHPIGIQANFFELGGHSLLAIRLFSVIEERFGKKLPLATLFKDPTIAALAHAIRTGDQPNWSSLVPIKPDGYKPPFFIVHGIGGGALYYHDIAKYLDPGQPLYGLQSKGFNLESTPLYTIEEMAAQYIHEIRELLPQGPFLIGGHSFGGLVAYEMAVQLHQSGFEPALVVLLDAYADQFKLKSVNGFTRVSLKVRSITKRTGHHLRKLIALPPQERWPYFRSGLLRLKERRDLQKWGTRLPEMDDDNQHIPDYIRNVQEANYIAFYRYQPIKYPGKVTLFRAEEMSLIGTSDDIFNGWKNLARDVEVVEVPGNHVTITTEPNLQVLAARLQACIDRANTGIIPKGKPSPVG